MCLLICARNGFLTTFILLVVFVNIVIDTKNKKGLRVNTGNHEVWRMSMTFNDILS